MLRRRLTSADQDAITGHLLNGYSRDGILHRRISMQILFMQEVNISCSIDIPPWHMHGPL